VPGNEALMGRDHPALAGFCGLGGGLLGCSRLGGVRGALPILGEFGVGGWRDGVCWLGRGPEDALPGPLVGVSAIVLRDHRVLIGRRRGAHGAGTWAFPGGKVNAGERPQDAVARELHEETTLTTQTIKLIQWTSDVFPDAGLHFVTLHHLVKADGKPLVCEPEKVEDWRWAEWDRLPRPLFAPAASLVSAGWRPPPR